MTSMMLRDSTLESLTPSVNAPSVSSAVTCIFFPTSTEGISGIIIFNVKVKKQKKLSRRCQNGKGNMV